MVAAAPYLAHGIDFDPQRIDAIFAELDQCHLPGAAVGIAIGGKPIYRKGFGLANMELPVVLSPTTRIRVGSITKQFTSLAYMLLCEEGKAGIEDPIGKYLPELHAVTHRVTMRQLMGHVSGLRDAVDIWAQFSGLVGRPVSTAELLSLYLDMDSVNSTPGTAWRYNNGAYLILGAAIERISGRSLEEVLQERILAPLGMYDTLLRRVDSDLVPGSAALHITNKSGEFNKAYRAAAFAGDGGLVSTVDDMLRWLAHMDCPVVGNPATWEMMRSPQRLSNGTSTGYGLGLIKSQYRGIEISWHGGGVEGGNAQLLKVPGSRLDIAVLVNRHDVLGVNLASEILDVCLPRLDPIKEDANRTIATGTFRSPTTRRVVQLLPSSRGQQIVAIDGFNLTFVLKNGAVLHPSRRWHHVKQTLTLAGELSEPYAIQFNDYGNLDQLTRQQPPSARVGDAILGNYSSDATGIKAALILDDVGGIRLRTHCRFGEMAYQLEQLADGIWRANSDHEVLRGVLSFNEKDKGFKYFSWRTQALNFRRCD